MTLNVESQLLDTIPSTGLRDVGEGRLKPGAVDAGTRGRIRRRAHEGCLRLGTRWSDVGCASVWEAGGWWRDSGCQQKAGLMASGPSSESVNSVP